MVQIRRDEVLASRITFLLYTDIYPNRICPTNTIANAITKIPTTPYPPFQKTIYFLLAVELALDRVLPF